ncbi:MAG: OmpA family protein [Burkholderiales bacterium]
MHRFLLTATAAAALGAASAQAQDSRNQGYLVDINGNIVTTTIGSVCVRDADWTPARAVEPCDPSLRTTRAPAPEVAATAAPLPAAPPPAAIPPPATAPVRAERLRFSADALFAFDKSDLSTAGTAMLDDLVRQLEATQIDRVSVTGHADRLGGSEYNQRLSERRAAAVKDYLTSRGVPLGRIASFAMGESSPVTNAGDCPGPRSARVIACLKPDRRVDVEFTGTTRTTLGVR